MKIKRCTWKCARIKLTVCFTSHSQLFLILWNSKVNRKHLEISIDESVVRFSEKRERIDEKNSFVSGTSKVICRSFSAIRLEIWNPSDSGWKFQKTSCKHEKRLLIEPMNSRSFFYLLEPFSQSDELLFCCFSSRNEKENFFPPQWRFDERDACVCVCKRSLAFQATQ